MLQSHLFCQHLLVEDNLSTKTLRAQKHPPFQNITGIFWFVELISLGFPENSQSGNVVMRNKFWGIHFHGVTEKLGRVSRQSPAPFHKAEEEQHLPLPVFWCGSFHGLWPARVQGVVLWFCRWLGILKEKQVLSCASVMPKICNRHKVLGTSVILSSMVHNIPGIPKEFPAVGALRSRNFDSGNFQRFSGMRVILGIYNILRWDLQCIMSLLKSSVRRCEVAINVMIKCR